MALTKAKISFLEGLDGSQLTGAMPALDGSSLTGISGMTKVTSDPALNTNPSSGVGTTWVNKSTGKMFVCTDATAGKNIWANIGGGDISVHSPSFQGEIAGYAFCGWNGTMSGSGYNPVINRYSFISSADATNHGNLSFGRYQTAGNASTTHGYASGGYGPGATPAANIIDKFAFFNNVVGRDVGNLTSGRRSPCGQSSSTHGYTTGGTAPPNTNICDKYAYASDGDATDVGDNTLSRSACAGMSSTTHGFTAGGTTDPALRNEIDKFSFASNNNATDVGDLTQARTGTQGASSVTHGYVMSGYTNALTTRIDKFAFATNNNSTNIGDVTANTGASEGSCTSSVTHGYLAGGPNNNAGYGLCIQKTSFATDGDAVDTLQSLTQYMQAPGGCQE